MMDYTAFKETAVVTAEKLVPHREWEGQWLCPVTGLTQKRHRLLKIQIKKRRKKAKRKAKRETGRERKREREESFPS